MSEAKEDMLESSAELDRELLRWLLERWESLQLGRARHVDDLLQRPNPKTALSPEMLERRYRNLIELMNREGEFDGNPHLTCIGEGRFGSTITETSFRGEVTRTFVGEWMDGGAEPGTDPNLPVHRVRGTQTNYGFESPGTPPPFTTVDTTVESPYYPLYTTPPYEPPAGDQKP